MKLTTAAILWVLAVGAAAAQTPDPAFLQKAIAAIQVQRENALNSQAIAEARAAMLQEEVSKLQARIKEIEPKPDEPKKP